MKPIVTAILVLLLSACASTTEEATQSQEELYNVARELLDSSNYTQALKSYEALQARYPYGVYADQAALDSIYAQFKLNERAQAVAECDRFIQLHPTHPQVDYAYYMKGRAQETGLDSWMAKSLGQENVDRDPEAFRGAFLAYRELVTRFPDSKYSQDARNRMDILVDKLALHELHAGHYYLERGTPLAAVNRAKAVLEKFPLSQHREHALALMMEGYNQLGLTQLRDDARRVLELNYPGSRWLTEKPSLKRRPWWAFWDS